MSPPTTQQAADAASASDASKARNLVFSKKRVFDAKNLTKLVFTLPGDATVWGSLENAYALDAVHGLLSTRNFVYLLDGFQVQTQTPTPTADQMFFDRDGLLWYLRVSEGSLQAQRI